VSASQTSGALEALVGLKVGEAWLGASLGVAALHQAFREIGFNNPAFTGFTPLQSHTYLSSSAGLTLSLPLGPLSLEASGAALLPFSVSASPYELGAWSGLGYRGDLKLNLTLSPHMSVGVYGSALYMGVDVSSTGAYSDRLYIREGREVGATYTRASTSDQGLTGGLLVSFTL
jgi:hypothetical protein